MKPFKRSIPWVILLLLVAFLFGCAATPGTQESPLLDQDFLAMSDPELTGYEQLLSDELIYAARSKNDLWLGFGFGSWGSDGGIGVSTSQRVGNGRSVRESDLRSRRDEVREEMRRRGLVR